MKRRTSLLLMACAFILIAWPSIQGVPADWAVDLLSPIYYADWQEATGLTPAKALRFIGTDGYFDALLFSSGEEADAARERMVSLKKNEAKEIEINGRNASWVLGETDSGVLYVEDDCLLMVPLGTRDEIEVKRVLENIWQSMPFIEIESAIDQAPIVFSKAPSQLSETVPLVPNVTSNLIPEVKSPEIPEEADHTSERHEVTEIDLGLIHYTEAPKTWTVDVPPSFYKVEAGVYGKDGAINEYGGWEAYLKINGNQAWKFVRHDNQHGGIFYDFIKNEEVQARTGEGRYLDVTSMMKSGANSITFYHYTEGDAGIKIRIHYVTG